MLEQEKSSWYTSNNFHSMRQISRAVDYALLVRKRMLPLNRCVTGLCAKVPNVSPSKSRKGFKSDTLNIASPISASKHRKITQFNIGEGITMVIIPFLMLSMPHANCLMCSNFLPPLLNECSNLLHHNLKTSLFNSSSICCPSTALISKDMFSFLRSVIIRNVSRG